MDFLTCELAKQSVLKQLNTRHNIEGIGVGHKWVNGKDTQIPAILVFVQQKLDKDNIISKYSLDEFIPSHIDGIPTDVIEVGHIVKQSYRNRVRPVRPGYSISHPNVTAGTLGGIFIDKDGDHVILSNNHVIADENRAKIGDIILQPATSDSFGDTTFTGWNEPIINLPYFASLKDVTKLGLTGNRHDSATAKIHPAFVSNDLLNFNYPDVDLPLSGFATPTVGMEVQKFGRTTGRTKGKIIGVKATFSVAYDFGGAKFEDCIVCTNMSSGGDSGSIICDNDMQAIGLLFAGSQKVTIASPISNVVERYGLKLPNNNPVKDLSTIGFSTVGSGISINKTHNSMQIKANANEASFIEANINKFKTIRLKINTGDDKGATWGPGAAVLWEGGFLKLNFRYSTCFGCTNHNVESLGVGTTKPNHEYEVVFKLSDSGILTGEIVDGTETYLMQNIRINPGKMVLRIGKLDGRSGFSNHSEKGGPGTSQYFGLFVN